MEFGVGRDNKENPPNAIGSVLKVIVQALFYLIVDQVSTQRTDYLSQWLTKLK